MKSTIKGLLYIAILTTAITISWIAFSIHHNNTATTIAPDTAIRITPIPPEFDKEALSSIKEKKKVDFNLNAPRANVEIVPETEETVSTSSATPVGTGSAQIGL